MISEIQQEQLDDARKGTLYFLGNLEMVSVPSFDVGLIGNFVGGTTILSDMKAASMTLLKATSPGKAVIDGISDFIKPIKDLFVGFFDALISRLVALYGEETAALEWVGEFGSWAVSTFVGSLAEVIPGWGYVQAAADIYDGTKKAVTGAIRWLTQVYSGWGVSLLEGEPSIISQAVARHNAAALGGGLKDMAVTSISVGLQAAGDSAGGAGSIFSAVTGFLQRIANMIGYCIQRFLMNRTFSQARHQWKNDGEMKTNHTQFNQWFKRSVVCTPVIASLVMCSGFVANPLKFLALMDEEGAVITQEKYNDGIHYIDKLKELSKTYINQYCDNYKVTFKTEDSVINGLLSKVIT